MHTHVPRIDEALLNEMILKIEVNEMALVRPESATAFTVHPKTNAETLDERLFKMLLFEQPISNAKSLIEGMRPAFYSTRFSKFCYEGLKALPPQPKEASGSL